jgi:hypothetical protein
MVLELQTITKAEFDNRVNRGILATKSEVCKAVENIESMQDSKERFFLNSVKDEHQKILADVEKVANLNTWEDDIGKLAEDNLNIFRAIFKQKQTIAELKPKIKNEFGDVRKYSHDLELQKLEELCGKANESIDKMHRLVTHLFTAMYNGVLIPGEVSIRHHKISPFRCQYKIGDAEFFNMLRKTNNQEAILKTLTNCEQQKIVTQLFEVMKILDNNKEIMDNDSRDKFDFCLNIPLKNPLLFIDRFGVVKFNLITQMEIKNYRIHFRGYNLMECFDEKTEEEIYMAISQQDFIKRIISEHPESSSLDINENNYDYFLNNFGEHIVKVAKELEKLYSFKIDFIEKSIVQIQNIGSKYLIADQLLQENQNAVP